MVVRCIVAERVLFCNLVDFFCEVVVIRLLCHYQRFIINQQIRKFFVELPKKIVQFCIAFISMVLLLEAMGISLFSKVLFTPFGCLFFFVAFLNEFHMISL